MNKLMVCALGTLMMVAAGGCATTYRVTEDAPPQPLPPARLAPAPIVVAVSAMPTGEGSARLASSLKGAVESRLASRGLVVASPLAANATVQLKVMRREKARLDDWRVYEGTAQIRVKTVAPERLLSETTIKANGQRSLDEVEAEQGVLDGLTKAANDWLDRTVTAKNIPVAQPASQPGCVLARVRYSALGGSVDANETLDRQLAFRSAVSAIPGICDCRLVPSASSERSAVYAVVYEAASFPDGLVNTIVAKLREQKFNVER